MALKHKNEIDCSGKKSGIEVKLWLTITYGEFQQHMKDYFFRTGSRMQFPEMADYLYRKGLLSETPPDPMLTSEMFGDMDDDAFNKIIDQLPLELNPQISITPKVKETDIFPNSGDVFIIRHPRYTRPAPHIHNYFEINYVASGSCTFVFEKANAPCRRRALYHCAVFRTRSCHR